MRTTARWGKLCLAAFVVLAAVIQTCHGGQGRRKKPEPKVKSQVVIGQFAPDFNVPRLRLSTSEEGQPIGMLDVANPFHLASLRDKRPVCLIMSSYT